MKKTAIVTGGSRGIGLGIVKQLGNDGFSVAIMAASPEENIAKHLMNLQVIILIIYISKDLQTMMTE